MRSREEIYQMYRMLPWRVRYWSLYYNVEMEDAIQEYEVLKLLNLDKKTWKNVLRLSLSRQGKHRRELSLNVLMFGDSETAYIDEIPQPDTSEDATIERVEYLLKYWRNAGVIDDGQAVAIYHRIIDGWSFNRIDREYNASHDLSRRYFLSGIAELRKRYLCEVNETG